MKIKYLVALILIITSVFISVNTTVASSGMITNTGSTTIQSPFTTSPPLIDGIFSINEWNNAEVRTFTLSYPNESYPVTLYIMNDGTNLYFGVTVTDNDYHMGDHISIGFNNANDFLYIQANNWSYDGHRNSSGYTTYDTEQGGTNDITAKAGNSLSNNNVNYIFEISHPFNSADDSNDISISPGDSVNFSISYLDMNRGYTSTNSWPSSGSATLILGSSTTTIVPSVTVASTPTITLVPTPVNTPTSTPLSQVESDVHVHKVDKLSLNNLNLNHNQLYNFNTLWTPNIWNARNLNYVIFKISTPLNFMKIENYEEYNNRKCV